MLKGHAMPSRRFLEPHKGCTERAKGRQKWAWNEGPRHPGESLRTVGALRSFRSKKAVEIGKVEKMPRKIEKSWIIVNGSGTPEVPGTSGLGV